MIRHTAAGPLRAIRFSSWLRLPAYRMSKNGMPTLEELAPHYRSEHAWMA